MGTSPTKIHERTPDCCAIIPALPSVTPAELNIGPVVLNSSAVSPATSVPAPKVMVQPMRGTTYEDAVPSRTGVVDVPPSSDRLRRIWSVPMVPPVTTVTIASTSASAPSDPTATVTVLVPVWTDSDRLTRPAVAMGSGTYRTDLPTS